MMCTGIRARSLIGWNESNESPRANRDISRRLPGRAIFRSLRTGLSRDPRWTSGGMLGAGAGDETCFDDLMLD